MLHRLLFGLLAACLAGALGAGLLSITPTPWRLLTASKSSSVFCSSASSAGIKSALPRGPCGRGHCRHVPPPQRGHRDRLDGPGAADKNRKQTDPHDGVIRLQRLGKSAPWKRLCHGTLGSHHAAGIGLSRFRRTALSSRTPLYARPWAGFRAPRAQPKLVENGHALGCVDIQVTPARKWPLLALPVLIALTKDASKHNRLTEQCGSGDRRPAAMVDPPPGGAFTAAPMCASQGLCRGKEVGLSVRLVSFPIEPHESPIANDLGTLELRMGRRPVRKGWPAAEIL